MSYIDQVKKREKWRKNFYKNVTSGDEKEKLPVCKKFGCGNVLTLRETMFSDYCCSHNGLTDNKFEAINLYLQTKTI